MDADSICEGHLVTVTAHATSGVANEPYHFTWYKNGVVINGATDSVYTETPVANNGDTAIYVYTVVASQPSAGCTSIAASDTLYVFPNPSVQISGDQLICEANQINLYANVNDYALDSALHYHPDVLR